MEEIKELETWKPIEQDPRCQVSNHGRVKGVRGTILKGVLHRARGYLRANVKNKHHDIHRLVGKAFIPNPENLPQIDHINQNKQDNRVSNLRWANGQQQHYNMRKATYNKNITSKYKGVSSKMYIHED